MKLCALEAIDTLSEWSVDIGDHSVESLCDRVAVEHGIQLDRNALTVEEVLQEFVTNHVG